MSLWGVGPADSPCLGYLLLMHKAACGSSTWAPVPVSRDTHSTLPQVLSTFSQSSLTRWNVSHLTAPLRGCFLDLWSPSPGRTGQVRAYGSFRVYDPRHFRVPSTCGAPRGPRPPSTWLSVSWPSLPAPPVEDTRIRTGALHGALRRLTGGRRVVVGRIVRHTCYFSSLLSHPPCPYTLGNILIIGGSGPTNIRLSELLRQALLTHHADLGGASPAPPLASSRSAHATHPRVPCPTRRGDPPQGTAFHLTAPLQGPTPGLMPPPPGRPGLGRAYGSRRVYDPRHPCARSTICASLRLLQSVYRFGAARPAAPPLAGGVSPGAIPVRGFALPSSPIFRGDSIILALPALSLVLHLIHAGVLCPTGRYSCRQGLCALYDGVSSRPLQCLQLPPCSPPKPWTHCNSEAAPSSSGNSFPPSDAHTPSEDRAVSPPDLSCSADQPYIHIHRCALGTAWPCPLPDLFNVPGFSLRSALADGLTPMVCRPPGHSR